MTKKTTESFLTFRLKDELFAISVHKVLEIIEIGEEHAITHLPKAPEAISGVVNYRGNVIPVVDTRLKFDLESYLPEEKYVIMILNLKFNNKEHYVGAMADKVIDVIEVSEAEIKPVPDVGQGYNSKFIRGVIYRNNSFVMLLNLEAAMSTDEIISLTDDTSEAAEMEESLDNIKNVLSEDIDS